MGFAVSARHTAAGIASRKVPLRIERFVERDLIRREEIARREAFFARSAAFEEARKREKAEKDAALQQWMDDAAEVVRAVNDSRPERVLAKDIMSEIAEQHGVTPEEIVGSRRFKRVVIARQHAIYEIRRRLPFMSLPMIGRVFGYRDHTTCLHSICVWPEKAAKLGIPCEPMKEPT